MDLNRKRAKEDQEITEICDLPDNVINNILDRLPIGDAVRTSILSRKWLDHWTRLENLVFDKTFIDDEIIRGNQHQDKETLRSTYVDAIGTVLLLHNGPIHKFGLHVPEFFEGPTIISLVNMWMHYVSRNGVKDITLAFRTRKEAGLNSLPRIFHCQELRRLSLQNCKADLPRNFTGFSNLISLHLLYFSPSGDGLNVLISSCPLLENLHLESYAGTLSISLLRLKTLVVKKCALNGLTLKSVPNLVTAFIGDSSIYLVKPHRIETFFFLMPNVKSISLSSQFLYVLGQHHIPKALPTPLKFLKSLTIFHFNVSKRTMLFALCILRSSPFLQALNVAFFASSSFFSVNFVSRYDENLLDEQFSKHCYPKNLVTVKIKNLEGTQAQIAFIKFILASCPALEVLYVKVNQSANQTAELKLMTELNGCSRASSKAKIIYSNALDNHIAMNSIFDF